MFSVYSDGEIKVHLKWNKESIEEVNSFVQDLRSNTEAVDENIVINPHNVRFHITDLSVDLEKFKEAVTETIKKCKSK